MSPSPQIRISEHIFMCGVPPPKIFEDILCHATGVALGSMNIFRACPAIIGSYICLQVLLAVFSKPLSGEGAKNAFNRMHISSHVRGFSPFACVYLHGSSPTFLWQFIFIIKAEVEARPKVQL